MIPYLGIAEFKIGPLFIHTWGLFVVLGFIAALTLAYFRAKRRRLAPEKILDLGFWLLFGGLLGGRLFYILFYNLSYFLSRPLDILKFWQGGMSVFGGLLGGLLAFFLFVKITRLQVLPYLDIICYVLPLGLVIGRTGCFLLNEHPGIPARIFKFLAVLYPDGPRYDLGLILAILDLLLFALFVILNFKERPAGFYLVFFLLFYGLIRLSTDFLRAYDLPGSDQRFYDLTPAQFGAILFVVIAIILFFKLKIKTRARLNI